LKDLVLRLIVNFLIDKLPMWNSTTLTAIIFFFSLHFCSAQSTLPNNFCDLSSIKEIGGNKVFIQAAQAPEFPGGVDALTKFITREFIYAKKQKQWGGNLIVSFIVNTDGSVLNPCITESSFRDPKMKDQVEQEALRVISIMPKWLPGKNATGAVAAYGDIAFFYSTNLDDDRELTVCHPYEKGVLDHGYKKGVWEYYDKTDELSLKINYDNGKLIYLIPDTSEYVIKKNFEWVKSKLDIQPRYLGSMAEFNKILMQNINYPATARRMKTEGTFYFVFEIDTTGKAVNLDVKNDIGETCAQEALHAFKKIPNLWLSAQKGREKFYSRFAVPISFFLNDGSEMLSSSKQQLINLPVATLFDTVKISAFDRLYYDPPSVYSFKSTPKSAYPDSVYQKDTVISGFPYNKSLHTAMADSGKNIFTVVEEMPGYPGAEPDLFEFLQKNIKYPPEARENGIQGRVYVTFVVDSTGNITDAKILRSLSKECDEEVLRIVNLFPKWKPGKQDGVPVNVQYNLPVNFTLSTDNGVRFKSKTGANEPIEFTFNTNNFMFSANSLIDKIITDDFKNNRRSDYIIGENVFSLVFPVDDNGVVGLVEPLTEWGHQFFEPVSEEIRKQILFPPEKDIVFFHLKINLTKDNLYQYSFRFSSKKSPK